MGSDLAKHWTLDPAIDFLNHGSFGACPRAVLEAQQEWRARMERQPVQFLARDLEKLLDEARDALARFVGADADDLVFVPNATSGVNTVVRSLRLSAGDEIVTTDHAYNACRNALRWHESAGVKIVVARVPWPISGPREVVDSVMAAVTPRTRAALIDHVTSPTGLIFPVEDLVPTLQERGVDALVDGAHAPGMLPLDLGALGAAYYTGNCHKWLCTPKGSGFLYVRKDRQEAMQPLAHGHGLNSMRTDRNAFRRRMDFSGTDDPTPFLCIPAALRFLAAVVPGGMEEVMGRNHALAVAGRRLLCAALRISAPAPEAMLGSLASVPLPGAPPAVPFEDTFWHPLQRRLLEEERIEVPVMMFRDTQLVRISAQLYNDLAQVERLASALDVIQATR